MRIVLFGDGRWASSTLDRLVSSGHEIALVVGRVNPSSVDLVQCAEKYGIDVAAPERINGSEIVGFLEDQRVDLAISVAYDQIFRSRMINAPRLAFINCHASMLPYYRGCNPINWALINGEASTGISVHHIDSGIDTGPIIIQKEIGIAWTDTYRSVLNRIVESVPDVVIGAIDHLVQGTDPRIPQPCRNAFYCGRCRESETPVDWSRASKSLYDLIRAVSSPAPGALSSVHGIGVRIQHARYELNWPRYTANPGEVVSLADDGVVVKTGDSSIVLTEISTDDGSRSFEPRYPIGTRFGTET